MKEKKGVSIISVSTGIIWMIYIVAVYLLYEEHDLLFFMCILFVSATALIKWLSYLRAVHSSMNTHDCFFYQSVITAGNICFFAEMVVAAILLFFHIKVKTAFILQLILLAVGVILVLISFGQSRELERRDQNRSQMTGEIRTWERQIKFLCAKTEDEELKKMLFQLSEKTRFSEPFQSEKIETVNKEIEMLLNNLKEAVIGGETEKADSLIRQMERTLDDRNNRIKILRRGEK